MRMGPAGSYVLSFNEITRDTRVEIMGIIQDTDK